MKRKLITNKENAITLVALVVTIIILLILAGVTINFAIGQRGIISKAEEATILTAVARVKEEIELYTFEGEMEEKTVTVESLLAEGKIRRRLELKEEEEENYYIYYTIKEGAFLGMSGLGKGIDKDVFLIDNNLNVCYIAKNGERYGDKMEEKKLEDDTQIRFSSPSFAAYVSKISGAKEEKMLFKWMRTQTFLVIEDETIDNLEDLVFFPNLTVLTITNVSNNLQSLSGIDNCKKLTDFTIHAKPTNFKDFSDLKNLPNLKSFCAYNGVV